MQDQIKVALLNTLLDVWNNVCQELLVTLLHDRQVCESNHPFDFNLDILGLECLGQVLDDHWEDVSNITDVRSGSDNLRGEYLMRSSLALLEELVDEPSEHSKNLNLDIVISFNESLGEQLHDVPPAVRKW